MTTVQHAEHNYATGLKALPLDDKMWEELTEADLAFMRSYISPDEDVMRRRVNEIQKQSYEIFPYPCIRGYHFVKLFACTNPIYAEVVEAGKKGDTIYLDVGCCMGTDVRKLVSDGYPGHNVYACDLRQEFIDSGFRLYEDQATSAITFFTSDAFQIPFPPPAPSSIPSHVTTLSQLQEHVTHLYAGALFHLFRQDAQYELALRLGSMLKREPGAVIYGRQVGCEVAHDSSLLSTYVHSPTSWAELWHDVFTELAPGDFSFKHVRIHSEFKDNFSKAISANLDTAMLQMIWSVRIV